jgi:flagellar hook-associated protein 1 FlgK
VGTLTGIMHVATSALTADQTALSTTAENISNQNTAGYTRRLISWNEGDTVSVNASVSPGVSATVITQRSAVLQRSVLQATEASSASSTRLTSLNNLQSLFAVNASGDDASGIGAAITGFFTANASLASTPTDTTARQAVYTAAQTLTSAIGAVSNQLTNQTSALNQQVVTSVNQLNGLVSQVAALNKQISQQNAGDDTNTLQDQRDQLITQVSQLVDVNQITNSNGSISLALANGTSLVSGSTALPLTTATVNGVARIYSSSQVGSSDVTSVITGGSIGGSLQVRDSDIPAVRGQLDAIVSALTTNVNAQNALGTDATGTAGGAIFSGTTAATFQLVATSSGAIAASSSGSNASAIAALQDSPLVNGQTFTGSFASMMSSLGQKASDATTTNSANAAVLTQTSTQLANATGVSLDTEAANLTQYQRSYEAAAKLLSIVNELMAQAINLGTETTVN